VVFQKVEIRKAADLTVWNLTVAGYCLPLWEVEAGYWCLLLYWWLRLSCGFARAVERLYPVRKAT
jgi:hypothetical protein